MKHSHADNHAAPGLSWDELALLPRWVAWKEISRGTPPKPNKVPYTSSGHEARINNTADWATRDVATRWCEAVHGNGVGFVLGPDDHPGLAFFGVDFDTCRDPAMGYPDVSAVDPAIWEIVQQLGSYTEISPSGTGIKLFGIYNASDIETLRKLMGGPQWGRSFKRGGGEHPPSIEPFFGAKYFTVTRNHLLGTPSELRPVPLQVLTRLFVEWGPQFQGAASAKRSGPKPNQDQSRSGAAFREAVQAHRSGLTYDQFKEGLAGHSDPDVTSWYEQHKNEPDERQFKRAWDNAQSDDLPHVEVVKGKFPQISREIEVIAREAQLPVYTRGAALCRPVMEPRRNLRSDGSSAAVTVTVLRDYDRFSLRRALASAMNFVRRESKTGELQLIEPPPDLVNMVLSGSSEQAFPSIRGVIRTPVLRPDLTLLTETGFDELTGFYLFDPPPMPVIPTNPTKEDAHRALDLLLDLISEFRFDNEVSKCVALSALVTPSVRAACPVVPGHLFNAPVAGSGKSLLVDTCVMVHTGSPAYVIAAIQIPQEQEKQLATAMLSGEQFITLDNLTSDPSSSVLAQAMERPNITIRLFGVLKDVKVDNTFCVYLTGNNVEPAGDNGRRILKSRLDPGVENPMERPYKGHPLERIQAARGEFVAAALTIVLGYIEAGCPCPLHPTPSYGEWSRLVREPLVWLGLADPTLSINNTFDNDLERAELGVLLRAWEGRFGSETKTAAQALEYHDTGMVEESIALRDALNAVAQNRRGELDAQKLGMYLRNKKDVIIDGLKMSGAGKDRTKTALWKLFRVD